MNRTLFAAALACSLAGCMTTNFQRHAQIDAAEKTITVPPGSAGLTGGLKKALTDNGWKMTVRRGPTVTEGAVGERTRVETRDTFTTRYELIATWQKFDVCLPDLSDAVQYDISVIDNKTGNEAFSIGGEGCVSRIVPRFTDAINNEPSQ